MIIGFIFLRTREEILIIKRGQQQQNEQGLYQKPADVEKREIITGFHIENQPNERHQQHDKCQNINEKRELDNAPFSFMF
jgi:hypothetical protein